MSLKTTNKQTNLVVESTAIVEGASPYRPPRWRVWTIRLIPFLLIVLLVEVYYLTYGSNAMIRLFPVAIRQQKAILISATDHPNETQSLLQHLSVTQTATVGVKATGTRTDQPTHASGELTWFNNNPSQITINAHTSIRVGSVDIQTDEVVVIPAANPPGFGQAVGPAHTVEAGEQGNIPANTFEKSPCGCGSDVLVSNTAAFVGGQGAKVLQVISQQDVDKAIASQKDALTQKAEENLQQQAGSEAKFLKSSCSLQGVPDHSVGSTLVSFQVNVSVTCTGIAFNKSDVQQKATAVFQSTRPAEKYHLEKLITNIVETEATPDGVLHITVSVQGAWVYSFSSTQIHQLQQQLAGKTPDQGKQILDHYPGVLASQVTCWWPWLPGTENIAITAN